MSYNLSEILVEFGALVIIAIIIIFAAGNFWMSWGPKSKEKPIFEKLYLPVKLLASNASLSSKFAGQSIWVSEIFENKARLNTPKGLISNFAAGQEMEIEFLSGGQNVLRKHARIKLLSIVPPSKNAQYDTIEVSWADIDFNDAKSTTPYISFAHLIEQLQSGEKVNA